MHEDPMEFFHRRGFDVTFQTDRNGVVWADLTRQGLGGWRLLGYGRGKDPASAVGAAMERWSSEQAR
jgi:hypothetical protein